MTHPAVDFVLSTIKNNWSAGSYSDIPLERVDDDTNTLLDRGVRKPEPDLKRDNYVRAAYVGKTTTPIGTAYDLDVDATVRVSVVGVHHEIGGKVDPSASLPPSTPGDPVPFNDVDGLVSEIVDTLHDERTFPDAVSTIDEKSLILNLEPGPLSFEYGDQFRYEFDAVIDGFEDL